MLDTKTHTQMNTDNKSNQVNNNALSAAISVLPTMKSNYDDVSFDKIVLNYFLQGYDYIICVTDADMQNKKIWATTNQNVLNDMLEFSKESHFGRIYPIKEAMHYYLR